jgi:hypothetical protein
MSFAGRRESDFSLKPPGKTVSFLLRAVDRLVRQQEPLFPEIPAQDGGHEMPRVVVQIA